MAKLNFTLVFLLVFFCITANVLILFVTDWARELKYWEAKFEAEVEELASRALMLSDVRPPLNSKTTIVKHDAIRNEVEHPYSFKVISKSPGCESVYPTKGNVFLLILVACRPKEIKDRILIRKTWGKVKVHKNKPILVKFLIALPSNILERSLVEDEIAEYGDIIQGDFIDSYKNMTLKVLMGLKWAGLKCPNATYVMNLDSDMFVNVYNLVTLLETSPRERFAIGHLIENAKPFRKKDAKWHTPVEMYPDQYYPPYLNGPAYVMSGDLPGLIFNASSQVTYLPWDDVFVGIVMKKIGIEPLSGKHFEDYPKLDNTSAILNAIKGGIATHVAHQNEPNPTLSEIWKNVSKSIFIN
ncbi:beta-1,3-galactosyltransferase 5-like [Asterias amurensis]|uniref:beta-1,3-galactosyltransferase 5-like n=1 Tax=Asterias amurensis TaxID=7602 RepID=UPI003AB6E1D6